MDIVKTDLWQNLKCSNEPVYLYGMGDGAIKIMSVLAKNKIAVKGIYANDEYVRGHSFEGFRVMTFDEVKLLEKGGFISLLAFATEREPLLSFLYERAKQIKMYAPDVPVFPSYDENGDMIVFDMNYFKTYEKEFNNVYSHLADDLSKATLQNVINFKLSGEVSYLKAISEPKEEIYTLLKSTLSDKTDITYVDLGAFTGDTFLEFSEHFQVKNAFLVEPDKHSFKRLEKTVAAFLNKDFDYKKAPKINCINAAAWSKNTTLLIDDKKGGRSTAISQLSNLQTAKSEISAIYVDDILKGSKADVIKLDVEGAEHEALLGAFNTIKKYKPKLMVSAYHRNEDLFSLFNQIMELNSDYKVYLRHHDYIPAWETCFYFV